jgi:F0F1-type ATP synthase gamma subunit
MAKARAIVKRRKAVRNIKKITKTMQMIADGEVPEIAEARRSAPRRTR